MIESLIKAGAMDSLEGTRSAEVRGGGRRDGRRAARVARPARAGRGACSARLSAEEPHTAPLPNVPDWTDKEKLAGEKELLGF